ncbi:MAG: hypothetical protein KY443_05480 [Actinobacteria bacterium]|nr:hypothetical protein [Actinomycetota bacterium]
MDDDRRRRHQAEGGARHAEGTTEAQERGDGREHGEGYAFDQRVPEGAALEEAEGDHGGDVQPQERDQARVPPLPGVLGQVGAARNQAFHRLDTHASGDAG